MLSSPETEPEKSSTEGSPSNPKAQLCVNQVKPSRAVGSMSNFHQAFNTLQAAPKSAESTPAGLQNFRPDTILAAHEVVEESNLSESLMRALCNYVSIDSGTDQ